MKAMIEAGQQIMVSNDDSNPTPTSNDDSVAASLGDYDILCGRHKAAFNNAGNRRLRVTVGLSLEPFMKAKSRKEKNTVIKSILTIVEGNGGRFLEYKNNVGLMELSKQKAHRKVGHALRDMALASRKENNKMSVIKEEQPASVSVAAPTDSDGPVDPLDILDSIPESEFTFDGAGEDIDMLQWLVGESNGLLHDDQPTAVIEPKPPDLINSSPSSSNSCGLLLWLVGESNHLDAGGHFEIS
jgi:hypothetical protein